MIYSPTLGFIFIKGLKVGGTSVEIALSAICEPQDIVTPITFRDEHERFRRSGKLCRNYGADEKALRAYQTALERWSQDDEIPKHPEGRFRNHMSLAEVQAAGLQTAELQMLICERSPYEKVVSLGRWRTLAQAYQRSEEMKASHREFISNLDDLFNNDGYKRVLNINRYRDTNGILPAFEMMRTNSFQSDFDMCMRRLGVEAVSLPWAKRTTDSKTSDMELLSRHQINLINAFFAEEFDAFGFDRI